jgi:hypothetical protein
MYMKEEKGDGHRLVMGSGKKNENTQLDDF